MGSNDKSGGFDHVVPPTVTASDKIGTIEDQIGNFVPTDADQLYDYAMRTSQAVYDSLRELGIPPEDARFVLPNAASCNLVMTANLRAILEFYSKRQKGKGAQWEIADFAEQIRAEVVHVDSWVAPYFEAGGRTT
jgi:thymidylate synthase (FAD)